MRRRSTALVAAAVAVAGLVVGIAIDQIDDGDEPRTEAAGPCASTSSLVAVGGSSDDVIGGRQVVVARADGTEAQATPTDWVAGEPDIGPDQRRLVVVRAVGDYESAGPEATHLWTLGLDGADPQPLTEGDVFDSAPRWSPDGSSIAFVRLTYDEPTEASDGLPVPVSRILVVPADGGEAREVVAAADGVTVGAPTWSPDGSRLAYLRRDPEQTGSASPTTVQTVGVDGTGGDEVGPVAPSAVALDWDPDGGRLLLSTLDGTEGELSLVDLDAGEVTVLARGAADGRWARGGTHVVHRTRIGTVQTAMWSLVERPLEGTTLGGTEDRGIETGSFRGGAGLAVAPCQD